MHSIPIQVPATLVPHFTAISCRTPARVSAFDTDRLDSKSTSLLLEDDRLDGITSPIKEQHYP